MKKYKDEIKKLTEIFKDIKNNKKDNFESPKMWKQDDEFYNEEVIYGPPKMNDWNVSTDDFMVKLTKKAIDDFMKDNFPGLTVEQIVELCKEKYPENYV